MKNFHKKNGGHTGPPHFFIQYMREECLYFNGGGEEGGEYDRGV